MWYLLQVFLPSTKKCTHVVNITSVGNHSIRRETYRDTNIHTGEKPFKCHVCQRVYVYPKKFDKHHIIPSGEQWYIFIACCWLSHTHIHYTDECYHLCEPCCDWQMMGTVVQLISQIGHLWGFSPRWILMWRVHKPCDWLNSCTHYTVVFPHALWFNYNGSLPGSIILWIIILYQSLVMEPHL